MFMISMNSMLRRVLPASCLLAFACATGGNDPEQRFWLENAVVRHGYTVEETAAALGVEYSEIPALFARHGIAAVEGPPQPLKGLRVLPYPGGRHPRIGFLDGAIDPHRDTKFSVFLPWGDGSGYVVVDLPEALWVKTDEVEKGRELIYLAHTHIPTRWDRKKITLERMDWTRGEDGRLEFQRRLPDGVEFGARVVPQANWIDMELWMKNGTEETLGGLRTQICVLLKGAPEFNEQTKENKKLLDDVIATHSTDGKRWIVTAWERARVWANDRCPCMHSDPVFPDLAPGERSMLRGRLFFYEGDDVKGEVARVWTAR